MSDKSRKRKTVPLIAPIEPNSGTHSVVTTHPLFQIANTIATANGYKATELLEEFRRFLALKAILKDSDASLISPTPLMDTLWHAAILNTKLYDQLQQEYGIKIHHNPEGASQTASETNKRQKRLVEMKKWYKLLWNEDPLEEKSDALEENNHVVEERSFKPENTNSVSPGVILAEPVVIFVKSTTGKMHNINVSLDSTVLKLKQLIQEVDGIPVDQQILVYGFRQLHNNDSLKSYNIGRETIVHAVLRLRGC